VTARPDPNPLFPPPRPRWGDLAAGIAVAFVLIPQALAYADIAGMPPAAGLFAATLPLVAAALVASSPYLQTGPVAMTALLTFGILSTLADPGSPEYIGLAALLALVVGAIRLLIGLVGAGVVSYFMSQPVLRGFTSAAALLIVSSQLPTALGVVPPEGHLLFRAGWALGHPSSWHGGALAFAVAAVIVVALSGRIHPLFPGVALVVVIGLVVARAAGFEGPAVGSLPSDLPPFSLALPWSRLGDLLLPGVVIALVGFAESAAIAMTYAARDRTPWNADREFAGQGLANVAAGLFGGFPVGGSFGRSSINRLSGARTRWSGAVSGLAVLAFLPFASVLDSLPRSILAGIVIAAVAPLVRPDDLWRIFRYSPAQGTVGFATFGLTLALAPRIDEAVLIGIGMGILVHLVRELRVDVDVRTDGDTLVIRPAGVLYFGSAHRLSEALLGEIARHPHSTRLVIDLAGVGRLDYTGAVALRSLGDQARDAGLDVDLVGVTRATHRIIDRVWYDRPAGLPRWRDLLKRARRG
jgi:SulP family sulfate permease